MGFQVWWLDPFALDEIIQVETMNKSPAHQQYETSDCSYEFDPQVNFSQFLEEARQHARDINLQRSSSCSEEVGKKRLGAEKKSKKSWRISLFSWWKINGKSKPGSDPVHVPNPSKPTKGYGSGPLCTTTRGIKTRHQRPSSGPVSILFTPTRKMENEVPYMSLDQPNDPYHINTYGPVYLVT
ncbi:hypothetical protein V6Z12_D10G054100 [Gossypium hirsutum]|uniref:Uncharacterized protein LOC107913833 n=2 Tax=Gossypium TaxID=3633 RepID=A0A1U8K667_GOSHI|nr:uncharacterized protein LOC107913833 isoform X1 [Gossypium hirsutum]XP_040958827.1 uncharacterized protein LOC107913833 isoform X1 [Gossypium hirsutum]TYH48290.1 hypothetical protein ES332_D10G057900v1 [Gossypium tomentosum]